MTKGRKGSSLLLAGSAFLVWLVDRLTGSISGFLGKMYCGADYLEPVDGIVGDPSCGFNADLYFTLFLFIIILASVTRYYFQKDQ